MREPTSSERSTIGGSTTGRCRSFSLPLESRLTDRADAPKASHLRPRRAATISWLSPVREPTSSKRSTIDGSTTGRCQSFSLPLESWLIGPCRRAESLTPATAQSSTAVRIYTMSTEHSHSCTHSVMRRTNMQLSSSYPSSCTQSTCSSALSPGVQSEHVGRAA